jgi:CBS domain-containing protein/anti-sigma regulatory factor (Ser/Thr protein kinase)
MSESSPSIQGQEITDEVAGSITRIEELAYELRVSEVMTRDVLTVTPDTAMGRLMELLQEHHITGAPVVEREELVGVVSIADLLRAMQRGQLDAPVRDFMTSQLITISADDLVVRALDLFAETDINRLPVQGADKQLMGIVTKSDITDGVLKALRSDFEREEVRRYRASHLFEDIDSDRTSLLLRYRVRPRDFKAGGTASTKIKRALLRLGADPQIARRCSIAACEAEMNLVIHTTNGGILRAEVEPHLIFMEALDDGPGIADIEQAKQPGFSTASEEVRALGFGAGFGLTNIGRCVDKMWIESKLGQGTRLEMWIYLQPDAELRRLDSILERLSFGSR